MILKIIITVILSIYIFIFSVCFGTLYASKNEKKDGDTMAILMVMILTHVFILVATWVIK